MTAATFKQRINIFLVLVLLLNFALWLGGKDLYAKWAGVPPVPTARGAAMMTLGDTEFSYRAYALTLQTLGDGGGRTTSLRDYDYKKLGRWLWLLYGLDPASEHVPFVAAFYFGAVHDKPEDTAVLVDYLSRIGQNPVGEKWRWLAEAAFMARHRMHNLPLALDIANKLSKMQLTDGRELPTWAREYPAFVLKAEGEKDSARKLMESMLLTEKNPNEVNFIQDFLILQLGIPRAEVDAVMRRRAAVSR